jgi:hypothetical protein
MAEAGLSIAIWIAVLAFGGASPAFFFPTQVIISMDCSRLSHCIGASANHSTPWFSSFVV